MQVNAFTPPRLLSEHYGPNSTIDFVSMDIEGGEFAVLCGAGHGIGIALMCACPHTRSDATSGSHTYIYIYHIYIYHIYIHGLRGRDRRRKFVSFDLPFADQTTKRTFI